MPFRMPNTLVLPLPSPSPSPSAPPLPLSALPVVVPKPTCRGVCLFVCLFAPCGQVERKLKVRCWPYVIFSPRTRLHSLNNDYAHASLTFTRPPALPELSPAQACGRSLSLALPSSTPLPWPSSVGLACLPLFSGPGAARRDHLSGRAPFISLPPPRHPPLWRLSTSRTYQY